MTCDFSLFLCLHQPFYILCKLFQVSGFSLSCFKVVLLGDQAPFPLSRGDLKAFYRPLVSWVFVSSSYRDLSKAINICRDFSKCY